MTSYDLCSNEVLKSEHALRWEYSFTDDTLQWCYYIKMLQLFATEQLVILQRGLWNWRTPPPHWRNLARDAAAGKAPTARWMDEHVTLLKHSRWCGCSSHRVTAWPHVKWPRFIHDQSNTQAWHTPPQPGGSTPQIPKPTFQLPWASSIHLSTPKTDFPSSVSINTWIRYS